MEPPASATEAALQPARGSGAGGTPLRLAGVTILPALLFVAIHVRALDYPLVWTDISAIGEGTMLRPAEGLAAAFAEPLHHIEFRGSAAGQSYYRPLQVVLLSGVQLASGGTPRAYRIATLAVGALCVAAWGAFALWLLGAFGPALFAAGFMAAHPVAIESTTWISGVSGSLCAFFTIATLALARRGLESPTQSGSLVASGLSVLALAAGLLSKERAVVEPVLLLALTVSLGVAGGGRALRRRFAWIFAAHVAIVAVYLFAWRPAVLGLVFPDLPPIGGVMTTQLLTASASWPSSLGWLFSPVHSTTSDAVSIVTSLADARPWLGALALVASVAGWIALLRRGRAMAALGFAWIWIAFAPTSGIVPMLHAIGERYLFLAAFGASLLLADTIPALVRPIAGARTATICLALGFCTVGFLAERTFARLGDWQSTQQLFGGALEHEPAYREAYFLLAFDHHRSGRFRDADARLRPLVDGDPRFAGTTSYWNRLSAYELDCANTLALGQPARALALDRRASRENASLRRAPTFRACVGQAHDALGQIPQALEIYLDVARQLGHDTPPRLLALITHKHLELGRHAEARPWLTRARRAASGSPELESYVDQLAAHLERVERPSRRQP